MSKKAKYIELFNERFIIFSEWVIDHRLIVIIICLIMVIGSVVLSFNLRIDTSLKAYFQADDLSFVYYEKFQEEYGNDEFIYIIYRAKHGIFDLGELSKIKRLIEDIEKVPYVERVNAVTNIEFIEGNNVGDIKVYDLMEDFPSSQKEADLLKQKLLDKPLYVNAYVTSNADFAAILCEFEDKPEDDPAYHVKIGRELSSILSKPDYDDFEFWPVGSPIINYEFHRVMREERPATTMLSFAVIVILLFVLFRQVKAIIGPVLVIASALCIVLGFMGLNDFPITVLFGMVIPLLLAVGVADSVHIMSEYRNNLIAGYDNRTSILNSIRMLWFPCLFTSLTTAVGFFSITTSPIRAIRDYGWFIFVGVIAAFIMSFTILLVIISFFGERSEKKIQRITNTSSHGYLDRILMYIAHINKKNFVIVLIVSAIISIIAIYGITKLQVNSSWLELLGDNMKVVRDYKFIDKIMGGSDNFEILLHSNKKEGVKTYEFIQTLEKIQNFADSKKHLVKKTTSVVDIIKDVNRALHNNDKTFYKIPSSDDEVSQYILLYEISGGEELEKLVSADIATARLTIYVKATESTNAKSFYDDLVEFIESVKPSSYSYNVTGGSFLQLETMRYIGNTARNSFMIAFAIISVLMIFIFLSVKVGFISLIPNIFPILITLGFMGIAGIWLDYGRSFLASIAISISVDDTIHLISRYKMEFDRLGNYEKALDIAIKDVGHAITLTTIILVSGFIILSFSQIDNTKYFGMLTSMCIFLALLADFFVTPALILLIKPFGKEFNPVAEDEHEST
ncbi:MAG: MMPL family transporter [Spirochaetota bacterium]|nr:MMPL family transporter [Spirochaetota bacterium]